SGTNSFTGLATINPGATGLVNLGSNTALGTGAITISGGQIDNTSGVPLTLANTGTVTIGGDFTFVGSKSLTMGSGGSTGSASRVLTLNGTNVTLGFGAYTFTGNSSTSLTANGIGNTLSLGGIVLTTSGATAARTLTLAGSSNFTVTGGVSPGTQAASG